MAYIQPGIAKVMPCDHDVLLLSNWLLPCFTHPHAICMFPSTRLQATSVCIGLSQHRLVSPPDRYRVGLDVLNSMLGSTFPLDAQTD